MAVILNEAAATFLGEQELINKKLYRIRDNQSKIVDEYHIIGIIRNFNFSSLHNLVQPLALRLSGRPAGVAVRINASNPQGVLEQIKNKWRAIMPGQPFNYSFMEDDFNKQYDAEQKTGQIFITFALLAILIASLGLFASYRMLPSNVQKKSV